MAKMVEVLMDGPNINHKLLKKLKEQRNELESPGLIDLSSCNLQIICGAFKSCAEVSGGNLKKLLRLCFQLLKDTLARRGDFSNVEEST